MKKYFAILAIIILPFFAKAQLGKYEEVVYLKNGNIYHGVIIEQIPGVSLKIKSSDRNVFNVKIEEVEKITREELRPQMPPARPEPMAPQGPPSDHKYGDKGKVCEPGSCTHGRRGLDSISLRTRASGIYLTLGPNASAHNNFAGVGIELTLGGKIFPKKPWRKPVKVGADVFAFGTALTGFSRGPSFQAGLGVGPTFAFNLKRKKLIYITPYLGLNGLVTRDNNRFVYDQYGNYVQTSGTDFGMASAVGLKFELVVKRFYFGTNGSIGQSFSLNGRQFQNGGSGGMGPRNMNNGPYARFGFNFGVKF
jgi:hypothetical protein